MSDCPQCALPYSHEDGHNCLGPSEVIILFRRARSSKAIWKPIKAILPNDLEKWKEFAWPQLSARHPRSEFKLVTYDRKVLPFWGVPEQPSPQDDFLSPETKEKILPPRVRRRIPVGKRKASPGPG